ncbi:MAG: hypothetical protein SNF33_06060 [Candidatus Algichlamydia australiensis]|nr:hypothetical protein [Chlamydiales bacterium]
MESTVPFEMVKKLNEIEQALPEVSDPNFFQNRLDQIRNAPLEEWAALLNEFEELLDMEIFK